MNTKNALALLTALTCASAAQSQGDKPVHGPWLPPAARTAKPAPQTQGEALDAQVLAKLQQQFQAADAQGRGAVNLAEAKRAGWGFAVQHFDRIDKSGRGEIRMQDLRRFAQEQQVQLATQGKAQ